MLGVFLIIAILVVLSISPNVPRSPPPTINVARFNLYVNATLGFASNEGGPYTRPGPTLTANFTQPFSITFYATDNVSHGVFIDYDDDGAWNPGYEPVITFERGMPQTLQVKFPEGTYHYSDMKLPFDNRGSIVVVSPPKPWFRWNPFFIFGLMTEIVMVGFVGFIIVQAVRWTRTRRKIGRDPDIVKWVAATMDPDAPTRLTVEKVRAGKWKKPEKKEEDPRSRM